MADANPDAGVPQHPPGGNAALATALQALATAMQGFNQQPHYVAQPILDPFQSAQPFDLASRAGSIAYTTACSALDEPWDGTPDTFPTFIISLKIRAAEIHWNAPNPRGILEIVNHNLLTHYHTISDQDVTDAYNNRADPRAVQNSKALYSCLKKSITGDLRATIFDQEGNLPQREDGPTLFKMLTTFTMVASVQLSMLSFNKILSMDPAVYAFNIPKINTKLNHLFVLATTSERNLLASERIQHTLTAYSRIRQPELWAQWVRNQVDDFDAGTLTNCQAFMNTAVIKYNKIAGSADNGFQGSATTVQEDIVAMSSAATRKRTAPVLASGKPKSKHPPATSDSDKSKAYPPFVKHFKASTATDAAPYKLGDKKPWKNDTWYFCDCPNHRNRHKWHTHPHTECRTRTQWLASSDAPADVSANLVEDNAIVEPPPPDEPNDLVGLLADALSLAGNNPMLQAFITDAMNAAAGT
jgi:hypothetical protein